MLLAPVETTVVHADDLAWITASDMVEVDRVMVDDLRIELLQMMEHAGRHLARVVRESASPATAVVLAGSGGNGGGGLVAARHLANAGVDVTVLTTRDRDGSTPAAVHQLDILERMGVPSSAQADPGDLAPVDVVVDAIIGYSLRGAPRGRGAMLIDAASRLGPIVALDTPSGLDVTTGDNPGVVVAAEATVTLALPKLGLRHRRDVGRLYLGDISVPPPVTARFGADPPPFDPTGLLEIDR